MSIITVPFFAPMKCKSVIGGLGLQAVVQSKLIIYIYMIKSFITIIIIQITDYHYSNKYFLTIY